MYASGEVVAFMTSNGRIDENQKQMKMYIYTRISLEVAVSSTTGLMLDSLPSPEEPATQYHRTTQ